MTQKPLRNQIVSGGLIMIAAWLAVYTRRHGDLLPDTVAGYLPDTLWAMAVFAAIGLYFPAAATWQVASGAYVISALFEFSQLYHETWIDALRSTPMGASVLGSEFRTTDLASYVVGVILGMLIELWTLH
jgi:hypothetical protein